MSNTIYHSHHIIPKYLGGTDHPDNLARLTVVEHAEAHRKLYEKYGHWQDKLAWQGLVGIIGHDECVARAYKSQLGKPLTEEHKKNISKGLMGHSHSDETRKKISQRNMGRSPTKGNLKHGKYKKS